MLGFPGTLSMFRIGLISDTHGLLRPEAKAFLHGSDAILHAGDVCDTCILEQLAGIAPTTAVRGNCDRGPWAARLKETESLVLDGVRILVVHDLSRLSQELLQAGVRVVLSGHSHQPSLEDREGVLFLNPGSAGPRRFKLPVSAGELLIADGAVSARLVELMA
jgi:uncharacterized protein